MRKASGENLKPNNKEDFAITELPEEIPGGEA
jgi:hypothetical protein